MNAPGAGHRVGHRVEAPTRRAQAWALVLLVLGVALGCRPPGTAGSVIRPDQLRPQDGGSRALPLGAGDVLEVRVYGETELSGVYTVLPEGVINFPLCGKVPVAGLSVVGVSDAVTKCLEQGYLRRPRVTAELKAFNSMQVFIFGEVQKPGAYAYSSGMTIIHAVGQAGGFLRSAAKNSVNVTRILDGREVKVPLKVEDIVTGRDRNFDLQPGDIIFVPESFL